MSEVIAAKFSCSGCNRTYSWKAELAGRRVKCKCGQVMTVPKAAPVPEQPQEDDLYDLAPSGEEEAKSAFSRMRTSVEVGASAPIQQTVASASAVPLAYQQGPTQRQQERMSAATLMDMNRDVYVPVALLLVGFILYVGCFTVRYNMGGAGIVGVTIGLSLLTLFKAGLLIGFAFVAAGPLGVSFGGIWTAALKLAAIAVFSDGIGTWVDAGVEKMTGGAGGMFSGMMSFPVVLTIFWMLLIYLFSMDAGDSWMVVICLAVFDMIVRTALMLLLLKLILGWGGVSAGAVALPALGGGGGGGSVTASSSENPIVQHVRELKEAKLLEEARQYIAAGRQMALTKPTEDWYAAGCKNVWFEVSKDINGLMTPETLIVELPKDKAARAKCYQILKAYYDEHQMPYDDEDISDDGEPYIMMGIPG